MTLKKVKIGILLSCLIWVSFIHAQNDTISITSGDLFEYLASSIDNIPSSGYDNYTEPDAQEEMEWRDLISQALKGNWNMANSIALDLDYQIVRFIDTVLSKQYLLIERTNIGPHWGTYVFRPNACRTNLVLMAPHSRFDTNTGDEATYCFLQTDSYVLMLAGTHRCNSDAYSTCSGSTSVCGSSENYRISDLAHTVASVWQETVEVLADSLAGSYFIQLHGFGKRTSDPYVIMSNGTRETPAFDPLNELANYLKILDPVLTFKFGHLDLSWNRLLGFSNTNGRYINNSNNPCNQNATLSAGRFLHIEQEKLRLRQDASGWDKMARAIRATFPGNACPSVVPYEDQNIWFVEEGKVGDAKSWATAHGDLARVLALTDTGDSIFISAGTYVPTTGLDQNASFEIRTGVSVFGGFQIGGSLFNQRNPILYPVVLSGDIGVQDDVMDDVLQTIKILFLDQDCYLDGLEIQSGIEDSGAAILTLPGTAPYKIHMNGIRVKK